MAREIEREMAMLKKGLSYRRQGSSGLIWADNMIVAEDGTLILNRHNNATNNLNVHGEGGFIKTSAARGSEASELSQMVMMSRSKSVGSNSSMAASDAMSSSAPVPVPAQAQAQAPAMAAPPTPTTAPARHKSSFRVMKWLKKAITKIRR